MTLENPVINLDKLNESFAFTDDTHSLSFNPGKGGIPVIEIKNAQASAVISLQGAHLLSWVPKGEDEVIWLSDDAKFAPAKSVRGGIPICWPWFGAHESESLFPAHGFARTVYWQVKGVQQISAGETRVTFSLDTNALDSTKTMWPTPTVAEYSLTISKTLKIELTTYNNSDQPIVIGQALHTYFSVDDVSHTSVYGLEDKSYLDKTDEFKQKIQSGPVNFNSEVDRVYLQTADDIIIDDQKRRIIIKKQGSQSTVVWNPWETVAEKMGDLGKDGYLKMLCVESANAAEDTVTINPGDNYTLLVTYETERNN